ncbi:MAG: response regulator [Desulfobulbaceae bacterium]|nr:response regulator [Desulfobulbaceae bacterium]
MKDPEYITTSEAGNICGVTRITITRWIDDGLLNAFITPGGHRKIRREDLDRFLAAKNIIPPEATNPGKKNILVVDDNPYDLKLFEAAFLVAKDKYQVHTASDGFEAVYKIGEVKPGIVVLDLMMPNMDGFEVCTRIKSNEHTKHIKVIVTMAHGEEENRKKALECRTDAFFTKPLDWTALIEKIIGFSQ